MSTPGTSTNDQIGNLTSDELMECVRRIRRGVRRRVRRDWPYAPLTESEVELLVLLSDHPGTRVGEAAEALGLAPNTVSTLVGRLVDEGLALRRPDPADGRAARLELSSAAHRRIADRRARRRRVVDDAMAQLEEIDRAVIAAALPALRRLSGLGGEP